MSEADSPVDPAPTASASLEPPGPARDALPAPAVPTPDAAPATSYAGFWVRAAAAILDFCVLLLLWFATDAVIRISAGVPVSPIWKESSGATIGLNCAENLVELAVWWLYSALSESSSAQATLGKRVLRLRVTDTLGRRISFSRATARTLGKILSSLTLCIGFAMAGFTRRRQALHDLMAETVVLRIGAPN
ncbi:MAG: RDD family protein [Acidobacteriota bacterium]